MKNLLQLLIFLLVSTSCGMSEEEKQSAQERNEAMVNEKIEALLAKQNPTTEEAEPLVDSTQVDSLTQPAPNSEVSEK